MGIDIACPSHFLKLAFLVQNKPEVSCIIFSRY